MSEAPRTPQEEELCRCMAKRTNTNAGDWFCVFKARHAFQLAYQAMREIYGTGGVICQLFSCVTTVNPILAAGMTPRYGECSAQTLALDPAALVCHPDDRALVMQHSFGIIDQFSCERLATFARANKLLLVEDSAHCAGRMARDKDGHPLADVSVHSFGVEKMCPTYFGGMVWINPNSHASDPSCRACAFAEKLVSSLGALSPIDSRLSRAARSYPIQIRVLNHLPSALSRALRARLIASGAFEPAVSDGERCGCATSQPARPSAWVVEQILKALDNLDASEIRRRETMDAYRSYLMDVQLNPSGPFVPASAFSMPTQPLMRFPLVFPTESAADAAIATVRAVGLYANSWGRPELTPGVLDASVYGIPSDCDALRVSRALSRGIVALPADVGAEGACRVIETLAEQLKGAAL